ncbi:MAG: hypothetical protein ACLFST_14420 [Spirochaetia bacterium]
MGERYLLILQKEGKLLIEDFISGNREVLTPDSRKTFRFRIKEAPSFLFLQYQTAEN